MTNHAPPFLAVVLLLLATSGARANEPLVAREKLVAMTDSTRGSGAGVDAYARENIVAEKGSTQLGAGFAFLTSRAGLGDSPVYFTDLAILRPNLRISVHDDIEIAAEADILAKQTQGKNSVVQSGSLSMIYGMSSHYALYAVGSSGSLYSRDGDFWDGAVGLMARKKIEEFLVFEGDLSGGLTELISESLGHKSKVNIGTVSAGGKIVGMTPGRHRYGAGGWVGAHLSFPLSQKGDLDAMSMSSSAKMNLRPSLNVTLGAVLRLRDWDLWLSYSILDRGDPSAPETTLPLLNGGFDQNQTTIGVTRRFGHAQQSQIAR